MEEGNSIPELVDLAILLVARQFGSGVLVIAFPNFLRFLFGLCVIVKPDGYFL
jgi:hypothetical protein